WCPLRSRWTRLRLERRVRTNHAGADARLPLQVRQDQTQLPNGGAGRLGVLSPAILRAIFSIRAVTNRSPSRRVRFAPRAYIRPMPAFMRTRPNTTLAVWSGTGLNEAADAAVERSLEVDARAPGGARGVAGVARCHPVKKSSNFNELAGKTIRQTQSQGRKSL